MVDLLRLYDAILSGDARVAAAVTQEALAARVDPMEIISRFLVPAMDEAGRRFECEEFFVPELLLLLSGFLAPCTRVLENPEPGGDRH